MCLLAGQESPVFAQNDVPANPEDQSGPDAGPGLKTKMPAKFPELSGHCAPNAAAVWRDQIDAVSWDQIIREIPPRFAVCELNRLQSSPTGCRVKVLAQEVGNVIRCRRTFLIGAKAQPAGELHEGYFVGRL